MTKEYDVSVIMCTYNSNYQKIVNAIDSALNQENVSIEIVIADDGSKHSNFDKIREYFHSVGFSDYRLVENAINQGTVLNYLSALENASGQYIRGIGAGDYLSDENALADSINFLKENSLRWAFSDTVYYRLTEDGTPEFLNEYAHPNYVKPYERKDWNECLWQYVVLGDNANGACIVGERALFLEYTRLIANKVKYAEDHIYRVMTVDGIVGGYFPRTTIFYEYGSGISTCGDDVWRKRLTVDWDVADQIIASRSKQGAQLIAKKQQIQEKNKSWWGRLRNCFEHGWIRYASRVKVDLLQRRTAMAPGALYWWKGKDTFSV